uniref:Hyccin n=1 Tax=Schistocephalus solidus TaxID=70667 RepID=A0A0X3PJU5_SCHSO
MRLRIPHPVQTWFTSIGGTSKRNPLLHRSDHTTADASASAQSNPAVLEAIQDLCYEIFAIPVATTEAVHIAQFVCGHIYEFAQSSQPSLQKMAMELLPTLIHVYLVMLANSGREEFTRGVSKTRRPPDAETRPPHKARAPETPLEESLVGLKVRKSFRNRVSNLAAKQSSNFLRSRQVMRQRTRKMFAGFSPQPVFRHKQHQQQQQQQPAGQVQQSPVVSTITPEGAELVPARTASLLDGLPAFAANITALSAILEACLLSLYNAYALRQSVMSPSRSTDGIPAALFGGSIFSAAIPTPAAVTAPNMLSPRVRTDLTSGSILLHTPTERHVAQSSSVGSSASSPLPPPLPSLTNCQTSVASTISTRGEQSEQEIPLSRSRLPREKQITASNRMRILCLLCRNYVDHVFTSSTLSQEALCQLALLLGPRGMQHSLPPRLLTAKFSKHRRKRGWNKICRKRFENIRTVDVSSLASTDTLAMATSAQPATAAHSAELRTTNGHKRLSSEDSAPLEGPEASTSISASCSSSSPSSAFSTNASDDDETGSNISIYSNSSITSGGLDEKDGSPPDGIHSNNNAGPQKTDSDGAPDEDDEYLSSTADPDPSALDEERRSRKTASPSFVSSAAVVSSAASTATSKDAPLNFGPLGAPTSLKDGLTSKDSLCRVPAATGAHLSAQSAARRIEVSTAVTNSAPTSTVAEGKTATKQRHRKTQRRQRHASDPARSASSVPPVSRIARLSSEFVLEMLPGLHYLLDTELAPRSVEAIQALESRATFELWPDVSVFVCLYVFF